MTDPDLLEEQEHLDRAHRELERMRAVATELVEALRDGARQDVHIATAQHRLRVYRAALDAGTGALSFGRIDTDEGDRWHIGRRHVEDEDGDPVVVDWRAGVATPFYRATYRDPQGLTLRRRLTIDDRVVKAVFDEDFDDPEAAHAASGLPDPLLAELDRERTGEMRDIVATIAGEQDIVIRAPMDQVLLVQGGPGTGKTAVGLHRAALLLYDHRERLERDGGVLVVGPNRLFLRYISQVLPSLGETAVVQTTIAGLSPLDVDGADEPAVAAIKGDARMVGVLRAAAWGRVQPPVADLEARTRWGTIRLRADEVGGLLELCCAEERTVGAARARFVAETQRWSQTQLLDRRTEGMKVADAIGQEVRSSAELRRVLDKVFPAVTAPQLVRKLLSSKVLLAASAAGFLDPGEQRALRRTSSAPLTVADVPLLDEAAALLGERPRRFGHVVVDEAQDLSAMALRMVARRCARGPSMTILGDLAQATAPAAQRSWVDIAGHLGAPEGTRPTLLTTGYRVPGQVVALANRLLPYADVDVDPTMSARDTNRPPWVVTSTDVLADLATVTRTLLDRNSSVAVISDDPLAGDALARAGIATGDSIDPAAGVRVALLNAAECKGLEFDAVVVVEPAALFDQGPSGVRLLYIAMTRPTQELALLHSGALPAPLAA